MAQSSIEWTEMTWNPTTGCTKITAGCKFCYAEVMSKRLKAMGVGKYRNGFKIRVHPETLQIPYSWKKPKTVFVNSMSDLFHEDVPIDYIKKVFRVMNENPQHTFQVLTKRADLLAQYDIIGHLDWTPNIWIGVSVENEKVLRRIDSLRNVGAAIRFLSLEPLIGPLPGLDLQNIDWVIVGGESGHGARPMKKEWVMDIKRACSVVNAPFFFKQWGKPGFNSNPNDPTISAKHVNHAKGGCQLNGKVYRALPQSNLRRRIELV